MNTGITTLTSGGRVSTALYDAIAVERAASSPAHGAHDIHRPAYHRLPWCIDPGYRTLYHVRNASPCPAYFNLGILLAPAPVMRRIGDVVLPPRLPGLASRGAPLPGRFAHRQAALRREVEAQARLGVRLDDFYAFAEPRDTQWKWRHGDRLIAAWHRDRGGSLPWDTVVVVQWDMLILASLERLFARLRPARRCSQVFGQGRKSRAGGAG